MIRNRPTRRSADRLIVALALAMCTVGCDRSEPTPEVDPATGLIQPTLEDALASLETPYYAARAAVESIRTDVLPVDDPTEQRRRFELIRERYGTGHVRGMLMALTVADHPNVKASLANLKQVEPEYERSVSQHVLADMLAKFDASEPKFDAVAVRMLTHLVDNPPDIYDGIDRLRAEANDYLALACMKRLVGKGHDGLILKYVDHRLPHAEHHGKALREVKAMITDASR